MSKYIEKTIKKLERSANRSARIYEWYQNYLLIIVTLTALIGGIVGGIIGVLIGFSVTGR